MRVLLANVPFVKHDRAGQIYTGPNAGSRWPWTTKGYTSYACFPFLMGYAFQRGRLPVGLPALERAIVLNGRAPESNRRALAWGRLAAHDLAAVERAARPALRDSEPDFGAEGLGEPDAESLEGRSGGGWPSSPATRTPATPSATAPS